MIKNARFLASKAACTVRTGTSVRSMIGAPVRFQPIASMQFIAIRQFSLKPPGDNQNPKGGNP